MMALYRREQTGVGAMVTTSLAVTGAWANGLQVMSAIAGQDPTQRRDEEGWTNPFTRMYGTGDGRYLMLALAVPMEEFPRLAAALDHPEWAKDPRFADLRTSMKNRHALRALLQGAFSTMTIGEADAALKAADVNFSVVARLEEVVRDPQLIANGLIVSTDSDEPGYTTTLASPFRLHGESQRTPTRAPKLGEHSREVLREVGLGESEIDALIEARILR
jgi:formyl-CoA transferase